MGISSSLATLRDLGFRDVLGDGLILGATNLALLLSFSLLLSFRLLLAFLDGLLLLLELSITSFRLLSASALDVLKAHTNDSLLDAGSLASLLTLDDIGLQFLVETTPSLSPRKLDGFDLLVEQRSRFGADEEVSFAVLGNEFEATSWVDFHLRELARVRLNNHLSVSNK